MIYVCASTYSFVYPSHVLMRMLASNPQTVVFLRDYLNYLLLKVMAQLFSWADWFTIHLYHCPFRGGHLLLEVAVTSPVHGPDVNVGTTDLLSQWFYSEVIFSTN